MKKEFSETTVGKLLDRFSNTGEIGTVETKIETKSLVLVGLVIIGSAVAIMAIKKYIFK
jgi:hypothetical protein